MATTSLPAGVARAWAAEAAEVAAAEKWLRRRGDPTGGDHGVPAAP